MGIAGEMVFARTSNMLRAPRLAIVIRRDRWELQAKWAIEALSRTWGGAGGVIIPAGRSGDLHPAVLRSLIEYDPDYLAPLVLDARQFEELYPGALEMTDLRGRVLKAASTRKRWLDEFGEGLRVGPVVSKEAVSAISAQLATFKDDGERVYGVTSDSSPGNPLSGVTSADGVESFAGSTGDALLDLAVLMRTGYLSDAVQTVDLGSVSSLIFWDSVLDLERFAAAPTPFRATARHLTPVYAGFRRRHEHVVVMGDSADDFALGMILNRTYGAVSWLPRLAGATRQQKQGAGTALSSIQSASHESILATSLSLRAPEVGRRLTSLWDARLVRLVPPESFRLTYVDPAEIAEQARRNLAVEDAWDRRRTVPVVEIQDKSSEMLSPPVIEWPAHLEQLDLRWIVEHDRHDRPLPESPQIAQSMLVARDQNPDETFIRVSRGAIAYERGRWDFVAAGASPDGRAAAPMLRWPSLQEVLQAAASRAGKSIRLSDAGRRAQVVTTLWGEPTALVADLRGIGRDLLNTFLPPTRANGPYPIGAKQGVARNGRGHVTFDALADVNANRWTVPELRAWLDDKADRRIIRRGMLLGCHTCGSVDFFHIDLVKQRNACVLCGAENSLRLDRWRQPQEEPQWFYDLHPAVVDLLNQHGDVPLMAWSLYQRSSRNASRSWFEFELVGQGGRPEVEFDVVGQHGTRIVLGEAKSSASLDGSNASEKERDARKLIDGALTLGASEVCLATSKTWDAATRTAVASVLKGSPIAVTVMEAVGTDPAAQPKPFR